MKHLNPTICTSLRVCKPAYAGPVPKPKNGEGCTGRASNIKNLGFVSWLTVALFSVAAEGQLVVIQRVMSDRLVVWLVGV